MGASLSLLCSRMAEEGWGQVSHAHILEVGLLVPLSTGLAPLFFPGKVQGLISDVPVLQLVKVSAPLPA